MPKPCTVTLHIDWELLRDQKLRLLEVSDQHTVLDGLVDVIDSIQDQAYQQGCDVKWLQETSDVEG
jgi:chitinase